MNTVLDFTLEEEDVLSKSAKSKKEAKEYQQRISEEHFITRSKIIQEYFLRLSGGKKKELILKLIRNVRSINSIVQIIYILSCSFAKTAIYTFVDPSTTLAYDALLLDHDRMLQQKTLQETMENDAAWFATICHNYQVSLLMNLIRSAGGNVKRKLYIPLFRVYGEKLRTKVCEIDTVDSNDDNKNKFSISGDEDYDPKHPATMEVERLRRKWADMMDKYKKEVHAAARSFKDDYVVRPEENKSKKSAREEASTVGSEKSQNKSSKSHGSDQYFISLQLIPVWISKKIFCYLGEKDLQSLKKVDSYCLYIVQDLLKERKARESLDAYLKAREESIGKERIEKMKEIMEEKNLIHYPNKNKRNYELGAIDERLVPKIKSDLVEESFVSNAMKEMEEEPSPLNGEIVPFPRLIKDNFDLYGYRPCFLKDVNIEFNAETDIERQKSFLTYSLASIVSALRISVDEETLNEW